MSEPATAAPGIPAGAVERPGTELLKAALCDILEAEIRPLLPRAVEYKLTIIARTDSAPKMNILITEDTEAGIAAVLAGVGLD